MSLRSMVGWSAKSKSSMVLRNGNRVGGVGLFGDEAGEELDVGELFGAGVFGDGGEHLDGPVQLQVAEVVLDLLADAHATSPSS